METAGTEDVHSAPDTVVLYSVSYQPTTANKDKAFAFMKDHPQMVMIDDTVCGKRLIELGLEWSTLDNDHDRQKRRRSGGWLPGVSLTVLPAT